MEFSELAASLEAAYPKSSDLLHTIKASRQSAEKVTFEPFFEPVSLIDTTKNQLVSFGPDILLAWIRHVSYATSVRLHSFEPAILSQLSAKRLLPAMVLIRSHLEASASACLAERSLMESAETGNPEPLQALVPKMLLGTSLRRAAKHNETIQELLTMGEQATITVTQAIGAMERFLEVASDNPVNGACRHTYAFLCEFTHPNPRGVRGFSNVLDESDAGWTIQYSRTEEFDERHVLMALDILCQSVRVGYAAAEILRLIDFELSENGFSPVPPPLCELRRVWVDILQGSPPEE